MRNTDWLGWNRALFCVCLFSILLAGGDASEGSRVGVGVLYNMTSGDIAGTPFDRDYFSYVVSIRERVPAGPEVEFSIDYYPGPEGIERVVRPFACIIWGDMFNYGLGVSRTYVKEGADGGRWSDFSYQLQAGIRFPLQGGAALHIDTFYFVSKLGEIKDIDTKYLTLGARLFFRF